MISNDKLCEVYQPLVEAELDILQPRLFVQVFQHLCVSLENKPAEQIKEESLSFAACVLGLPGAKFPHFKGTVTIIGNVASFRDMLNATTISATKASQAFRAAKDGAARQDKFWQLVTVMPAMVQFYNECRDIAHASDMRQSAVALLVNASQLAVEFNGAWMKQDGVNDDPEKVSSVNNDNWTSKFTYFLEMHEACCNRICANFKEWITLNADIEDVERDILEGVSTAVHKCLTPLWLWAEKLLLHHLKALIEQPKWILESSECAESCNKILRGLVLAFISPT